MVESSTVICYTLCMRFTHASTKDEIQSRIQRGYLDRLDQRVRKMRQCLAERDWDRLRVECLHLKNTAPGFGLTQIAELAGAAANTIPSHDASRATNLPGARQACERLFSEIENALQQSPPRLL